MRNRWPVAATGRRGSRVVASAAADSANARADVTNNPLALAYVRKAAASKGDSRDSRLAAARDSDRAAV